MTTYDVSVTREGRWWMVSVPEIDQLTQARRLSEIEQAARELIAVTLDVPMSTVDVSVKVEQVGDIRDVSGRAEARASWWRRLRSRGGKWSRAARIRSRSSAKLARWSVVGVTSIIQDRRDDESSPSSARSHDPHHRNDSD